MYRIIFILMEFNNFKFNILVIYLLEFEIGEEKSSPI